MKRRALGVLLAGLVASLPAACGGGASGSAAGAGAGTTGGSVTLTAGNESSPGTIQSVPPAMGRYFLTLSVTLDNVSVPSAIPAGFAYYALSTSKGLVLMPSAESTAVSMPCASDTSLSLGAQYTCTIAFEVPSGDSPTLITYDDKNGHTATAPVSYTPPAPGAACATLATWNNTASTACQQCIMTKCQSQAATFSGQLSDMKTCPTALTGCMACPMSHQAPTYCSCWEGCIGGCKAAFDALDQCAVDQCSAPCM
jgi:hypothetical protein